MYSLFNLRWQLYILQEFFLKLYWIISQMEVAIIYFIFAGLKKLIILEFDSNLEVHRADDLHLIISH